MDEEYSWHVFDAGLGSTQTFLESDYHQRRQRNEIDLKFTRFDPKTRPEMFKSQLSPKAKLIR